MGSIAGPYDWPLEMTVMMMGVWLQLFLLEAKRRERERDGEEKRRWRKNVQVSYVSLPVAL